MSAWIGKSPRLGGGLRAVLLAVALLALASPAAQAQSHSHGYLFAAPGVVSGSGERDAALDAGVGGEGVFLRVIGIGSELGALGVRGGTDTVFGLSSFNGYFHIPHANEKIDPFLTAGYSSLFQFDGHENLFNIGGGMNYWFAPHLGLKLEFRDHVHSSNGTINIATFRFGLAFH